MRKYTLMLPAALCAVILSSCSELKKQDDYMSKQIERSLDQKIQRENLIRVLQKEQDIAVYQNSADDTIHIYIFKDEKAVYSGFFSKEDIDGELMEWTYTEGKPSTYLVWGLVSHQADSSQLLLNDKPFNPNYVKLEGVSLFFEFFNDGLRLPVHVKLDS